MQARALASRQPLASEYMRTLRSFKPNCTHYSSIFFGRHIVPLRQRISRRAMLTAPRSRAQGRRWRRHHASELAAAASNAAAGSISPITSRRWSEVITPGSPAPPFASDTPSILQPSMPDSVPPPLPPDAVAAWQPPLPPEPASQPEPHLPPAPAKQAVSPSPDSSPHSVRWVFPPLPPLPQLSPALQLGDFSAMIMEVSDDQILMPDSPTGAEHSWKPPLPPLPEVPLESCCRCLQAHASHSSRAAHAHAEHRGHTRITRAAHAQHTRSITRTDCTHTFARSRSLRSCPLPSLARLDRSTRR